MTDEEYLPWKDRLAQNIADHTEINKKCPACGDRGWIPAGYAVLTCPHCEVGKTIAQWLNVCRNG